MRFGPGPILARSGRQPLQLPGQGVVFFSPLFCDPVGEEALGLFDALPGFLAPLAWVCLTGWFFPPALSLVF